MQTYSEETKEMKEKKWTKKNNKRRKINLFCSSPFGRSVSRHQYTHARSRLFTLCTDWKCIRNEATAAAWAAAEIKVNNEARASICTTTNIFQTHKYMNKQIYGNNNSKCNEQKKMHAKSFKLHIQCIKKKHCIFLDFIVCRVHRFLYHRLTYKWFNIFCIKWTNDFILENANCLSIWWNQFNF